MNGRLHRWSFYKLQSLIEYKAKVKGIKVVFVSPAFTSSLMKTGEGRLSTTIISKVVDNQNKYNTKRLETVEVSINRLLSSERRASKEKIKQAKSYYITVYTFKL